MTVWASLLAVLLVVVSGCGPGEASLRNETPADSLSDQMMLASTPQNQNIADAHLNLNEPIVIRLADQTKLEHYVFPRPSDPFVMVSVEGRRIRHFPFDRDVLIEFPNRPLRLDRQIEVWGGHKVTLQNGNLVVPADPHMPRCKSDEVKCRETLKKYISPIKAAVVIESPKSKVHLVNMKIDVRGNAMDGVALRNRPDAESVHGNRSGISVLISDSEILNVGGTYETLHGDLVHMQVGRLDTMVVERFKGTTGYQGFFLKSYDKCDDPKKPCFRPVQINGPVVFNDVDIKYAKCPYCNDTYLPFFIYAEGSQHLDDSIKYRAIFRDVRVDPSPNTKRRTAGMVIFPTARDALGAYPFLETEKKQISFPCGKSSDVKTMKCPLEGKIKVGH